MVVTPRRRIATSLDQSRGEGSGSTRQASDRRRCHTPELAVDVTPVDPDPDLSPGLALDVVQSLGACVALGFARVARVVVAGAIAFVTFASGEVAFVSCEAPVVSCEAAVVSCEAAVVSWEAAIVSWEAAVVLANAAVA